MVLVFEYQEAIFGYRSIDLNVKLILALNMGGSSLLSEYLLARVRRVPSALALHSGPL